MAGRGSLGSTPRIFKPPRDCGRWGHPLPFGSTAPKGIELGAVCYVPVVVGHGVPGLFGHGVSGLFGLGVSLLFGQVPSSGICELSFDFYLVAGGGLPSSSSLWVAVGATCLGYS